MFLSLTAITFPVIDPVIFGVGPVSVRWYSLAYIAGILLGWWYVYYLNRTLKILDKKSFDDLIIWCIAGIIIGGRLGYVLFYSPAYYAAVPSEIFMLWHGGMSFHGGMLGVILAIYIFSLRRKLPFLGVTDLVAAAAPIGLCLGRLANFINGELYGRVTDVPWAMAFPLGGAAPRHPSQIYEAALEGALLFVILFCVFRFTKLGKRRGVLSGLFLCGYAAFRSFVELYREPDTQIGYILDVITMGQLLCIPMFVLGSFLVFRAIEFRHK